MVRFSIKDCQNDWSKVENAALTQAVTISSDGKDLLVVLPVEEYTRLKRRDRKVLGIEDFTKADIAAIEAAQPPDDAGEFNHEMNI